MNYYICNELINTYQSLCSKNTLSNSVQTADSNLLNISEFQNYFHALEDTTFLAKHSYKDISIESCLEVIDIRLYDFWNKYKDGSSDTIINKYIAYIYTWYKFSKDVIMLLYNIYHDKDDNTFSTLCKSVCKKIKLKELPPLTEKEKSFISLFGKRYINDDRNAITQILNL